MNKRYFIITFFWLLVGAAGLKAQQLPISMNYIFRPGMSNPAYVGAKEYNNLHVSHQQRKVLVAGWRSISQFVNYNSQPLGKHGNWGWGFNIINDVEHTENRLGLNAAIAVQVIKTENSRLSLGGAVGMINWNSTYEKVRVFDRNDELLNSPLNFAELDMAMGFDYELRSKILRLNIGGSGTQLPGNFLSSELNGLRLYPHGIAGASVLFSPLHNFFVGPMAFYKNTIFNDTTIIASQLDVGLKGELDRQDMWVGAAYRINRAALTLAFGMQIFMSDTVGSLDQSGIFVDLNAGFSYPMGESSVFGPSMEIGLDVNFGRPYRNKNMLDTLRMIDGAFWKNDGNLNRHTDNFLKPNAPPGLRSETYVTSETVILDYEFSDQSLQYVGSTPDISGDTLKKLGLEWVGVDGLLEGMVEFVLHDALNPDSNAVINIDSLEALRSLVSLQLEASLQASEQQVNLGAEGTVYEGELGTNNASDDTLFMRVVYNDADTIVAMALNHYVTNLELACLKLYSMRQKLLYELEQAYGEKLYFYFEGDKVDARILGDRKPVQIRKPRITPNHPNQDAFQVNHVALKFKRFEKKIYNDDGEVVPDDLPTKTKRGKNKRQNGGRVRDRR